MFLKIEAHGSITWSSCDDHFQLAQHHGHSHAPKAVLGTFRPALDISGACLEPVLRSLGVSRRNECWTCIGLLWACRGLPESSWGGSGLFSGGPGSRRNVLGLSWTIVGLSGAVLGSLGQFRASWACIGSSWDRMAVLGLSWAIGGPQWEFLCLLMCFICFEDRLELVWASWRACGRSLDSLGQVSGGLEAVQGHLKQVWVCLSSEAVGLGRFWTSEAN